MRLLALRAALLTLAALAAGCASFGPEPDRSSAAPQARDCAEWLADLDARVEAAGVRDAQDTRVPGFRYLRTSRLLSALRPAAAASEPAFQALADRMLALDQSARRHELRNLSADGTREPREAMERALQCARLLREADLGNPELRSALLERAVVPDDYRTAYRVLGLYALSRFPFASGVRSYQREVEEAFRRDLVPAAGATLVRHAPPPAELTQARASRILERAAANPLRIPEPGPEELSELLAAYAPSFEIETRDDNDRYGALRWLRDGDTPAVDASSAVVYAHPAWTLYEGRVLLQLVYTIWFPARPPQSANDILAGRLDGITWRVTLAPDGAPLVYDAIHPCGCYHQFFPTPRARALPPPDPQEEWMFSPQALPAIGDGERPLLRIASGTHFIERVGVVRGLDSVARYELRPYDDLRSLFRFTGRTSAFGPDGLVPGTERPERLLFWPMGIESAGAMRQWGRHATAFVGRRHFDDADLFEKRFRFSLP